MRIPSPTRPEPTAYDESLAARVRALLVGPDQEERKMFGGLAFLTGGRMCCGVQGTDLMVRVSGREHDQVLRRPHVRPMDFTGRPMKGFVYVSAAGTASAAALRRWVEVGLLGAKEAKAGAPALTPSRRR